MANIKGKISSVATRAKTTSTIPVRAKVVDVGTVNSLESLTDVDLTGVSDGAVLQYNGSQNKFKPTNSMNNENLAILGGGF